MIRSPINRGGRGLPRRSRGERRGRNAAALLCVLCVLCGEPFLAAPQAAKKGPSNVTLEPPQPLLNYIFPAGGQRGQTIEATASGTNLVAVNDVGGANAVRFTGGGIMARVIEAKEANKARISITIAPDAELGEREVRFVTAGGISNRYRFMVGQLPEINEVEPNSEKDKAQRLASLPVVVNGQITDGDRDYFRFSAKTGQTLVLEVRARTLLPYIADAVPGWFDPCLTLYDSNGKELKYDDDFRFKPDPVMFFTPPKDGEYVVEIRDVIYRGRADFIYRLVIGAVPYVTHIFPLGGPRNSTVDLELHGVNLPTEGTKLTIPRDSPRLRYVIANRDGLASNGLPFIVGEMREVREVEPNDTPAQAQRVEPPVTINGRIQKSGDVDYYVFKAQAGQKLVMEVQARRLDSPMDSILTVFNPRGDVVAENDDWVDPVEALITHHADSRLIYTFPSAGDYVLRVRDIQGNGGEEYAYRLVIAPPKPDFALRIIPDNPRLGQGDTVAITVNALRLDGLDGEINLSVEGLPEGFVASEAVIPAGQDQARLTITAPPDASIGVLAPAVVGKATVEKETITRKAEAAEAVQQAFAFTHNVPAKQLFLAVVKPAAYTLSAKVESAKVLEVRQDTEVPIAVKILRKEGAKVGVSVTMPTTRPIPGISVKSVFVAPDKDEATVMLSVTKEARAGQRQNIIISGTMKTGKETIVRYAPAIPIQVVAAQQ